MTNRASHANVLEQIAVQARTLLPDARRNFEVGVRYGLVQLHFDDHQLGHKVHYEIWQRTRFVELGLHFESDAATNDWLYSSFAQRQAEIDAQLNADAGPLVLVERWDKGWTRVHCEFPISGSRPDANEQPLLAARLADMISVLHPMLLKIVAE